MDPLSISASCFALVGGIAKATVAVVEFTRDVRHANEDLDAIAAALQFLGTILTPFATNLPTLKAIPLELMQRVDAILKGCATAVEQIDKNVTKYRKNKVFAKIGWIVSGQAEMQKLRRDLEGYKSMLHLGLQVISISVNQVVKEDTTAIRVQNEALMTNVGEILTQIKGFQAGHRGIEEWMDDISALTSYAETAYAETVAYAETSYAESVAEPAESSTPPPAESTATDTTVSLPIHQDDGPIPPSAKAATDDTTLFEPVYQQGDPGHGIGGYDLRSESDRCFALDYNSTGKLDHLVLFRPGTGLITILQNTAGVFTSVYQSASGIGTFDILSPLDRAVAFDYTGSGCLDHIIFYRPGYNVIYILGRLNATYTAVFESQSGIGGVLSLGSPRDRIFAFDYNHSGKQDHLAVYRPGMGEFWIFRNDMQSGGTFTPVYDPGRPGQGIGNFDLIREHDRAFAFDWDGTGKMDHIVLYRSGDGILYVVKNDNGKFIAVWASHWTGEGGVPAQGVGEYNLADRRDVAFAYDWAHTGRRDHIALYRPGTGTFWVIARDGNGWEPVFHEGDPGRGVGGYDLMHERDTVFAFDHDGKGKSDGLVVYRANGTGTIWILKHV